MHRNGIILNRVSPGIIRIGFPHLSYPGTPAIIKVNGQIIFKGSASILLECDLNVTGKLVIGDNFNCNQGTKIDAKAESSFGDDVLIGHHCYFSDDDGHKIIIDGNRTNCPKGYNVGNHVWLSRDCKVLKGTGIADNCVIAAGAIVSKKYEETNCILAGAPAKIVRRGITWEK